MNSSDLEFNGCIMNLDNQICLYHSVAEKVDAWPEGKYFRGDRSCNTNSSGGKVAMLGANPSPNELKALTADNFLYEIV